MKKTLLIIIFTFALLCFISCSDENVENNDSAKANEKNTSNSLNNDTVYDPEEELAFYSFLQEKYESADDYYNDHPIFYDRNGEGQISQYGGMTWIQYSIDDFDNDGYKEMLLLTTFYTGDTYSADAMGMLYMYEYVNGQVEIDNYCNFDGTLDLTSPEFMIKNSDVVYWERLSSGAYNLVVLPFSSENREKLGMKAGEYLIYGLGYYDTKMMSRMIVSGFSVNDIEDLPADEYDAETGELLKGDFMNPVIHDVTQQGIAR